VKKNKTLLIGNWKLNPTTEKQAVSLFKNITKQAAPIRGIDFAICAPAIYLSPLRKSYRGKKVSLGAQNIYPEASGAHTGEVSAKQLRDIGIEYVICGHSERRREISAGGAGETDEVVATKVQSVLKEKLIPVVCVGEWERDHAGHYLKFLEDQIAASLKGLSAAALSKIVIAYEPVWAIGGNAGSAINGHELHQVMLYIRKVLTSVWGKTAASKATIIYGGSVKPENAYDLTAEGMMDGFLPGGASLKAESFIGIAKEIQRAHKDANKATSN